MRNFKITIFIIIFASIVNTLTACKKDNSIPWQLGKQHPMHKVLVDLEKPKNIKICADTYKFISFALYLHIDYDDQRYYGLMEGLCITVLAKKVEVKFATPSSGKEAYGTYEVLDD